MLKNKILLQNPPFFLYELPDTYENHFREIFANPFSHLGKNNTLPMINLDGALNLERIRSINEVFLFPFSRPFSSEEKRTESVKNPLFLEANSSNRKNSFSFPLDSLFLREENYLFYAPLEILLPLKGKDFSDVKKIKKILSSFFREKKIPSDWFKIKETEDKS